ncbi:MAG: MFS transporter [Ilumatobacteraceae bacterium]
MTSRPASERLFSREFAILAVSTSLFFGGMGALNPLLAKFVVDELHGSDAMAGVVVGSFAVSSLVLRSWCGRFGDRRGARPLIIGGCVVGALGMLVFVLASTIPVAIVARLLQGAGQAAVMTGSTVLAIDMAPLSRRGEAASYILVAFHLGLGLGPLLGESVLDRSSWDGVWYTLGALTLAAGAVAMFLPRRPGHPDAAPSPLINRRGVAPGTVVALGMVPFVAFSTFVPLYGREVGLEEIGPVFVVGSLGIALSRVAFGKAPDLYGPIRTCTVAIIVTVIGSVVVSTWSASTGIFVAAAILAGGMAMQTPSLIPVAVHGVPTSERSSAMATFTMFIDLSAALTGPVFGLLAGGVGYQVTFLVGGFFAVAALVVLHVDLAPRWRDASALPPTTLTARPASG